MPQQGVSVPRGKVHRGDRWSDDLELEFPTRRARTQRRANRPPVAPVLALEDDPYNLDLDLHFDLGLTPERNRGAVRPESPRPSAAGSLEPPRASLAASLEPPRASATVPARRTVTIHGRPADRYQPVPSSRRRQPPPHRRAGFQPDRVAMWAVFLGLVLLLVAATSSHAAVLGAHAFAGLAAH